MVEDEGCGQATAGGDGEAVAQLDRGEGVETEFVERPVDADSVGAGVAENGGDAVPDHLEKVLVLLVGGQCAQVIGQARAVAGAGTVSAAGEGTQERWRRPAKTPCADRDGDEVRPGGGERRVEEFQALLIGDGAHPDSHDAVAVGVGEVGGHAGVLLPV
ncbi:hypothetical protein ACFHW2_43420, partial [Actinomadura sp. LOL_016]|uniref:hypothetical protein n=1 Tax=Actinomadura sp. LOL_016 TaxID=3345411 RepID=UPI003A8A247B